VRQRGSSWVDSALASGLGHRESILDEGGTRCCDGFPGCRTLGGIEPHGLTVVTCDALMGDTIGPTTRTRWAKVIALASGAGAMEVAPEAVNGELLVCKFVGVRQLTSMLYPAVMVFG
jgi:hypothetical protein